MGTWTFGTYGSGTKSYKVKINSTTYTVPYSGKQLTVNTGDTITLTAVDGDGWEFVRWRTFQGELSTKNPFSFTVTSSTNYAAMFCEWEELPQYQFSLDIYGNTGGTAKVVVGGTTYNASPNNPVTVSGVYSGSTAVFTATPASGKQFVRWRLFNAYYSTDNPMRFTVDSNGALLFAEFEDAPAAPDISVGTGGSSITLTNLENFVCFWAITTNPSKASLSTGYSKSTTVTPQSYGYIVVTASSPDDKTQKDTATLNICSVTYNANGGSGEPGTEYYIQSGSSSHTFSLSSSAPTRSGYIFKGWGSSSSSTSTITTKSVAYRSNSTVYAVWESIPKYRLRIYKSGWNSYGRYGSYEYTASPYTDVYLESGSSYDVCWSGEPDEPGQLCDHYSLSEFGTDEGDSIQNISGNMTVYPTTRMILTITASVTGTGGSISPAGGVSVAYGTNQSFTIAPNSGYCISSLKVDGISQSGWSGVTSSKTYTFTNVSSSHTIVASFEKLTSVSIYRDSSSRITAGTIKIGSGSATAISWDTTYKISPSTTITIDATMASGCALEKYEITADETGEIIGTGTSVPFTYQIDDNDVSIYLTSIQAYTVTFSISSGSDYGSISTTSISVPRGTTYTSTDFGATLVFSDEGTLVGGVSATPNPDTSTYIYSFNGWSSTSGTITSDTTITCSFSRTRIYTVSFIAGAGGSVSQSIIEKVPSGSSISVRGNTVTINGTTVTATADSDCAFNSWSNASGTITSDRTITANFTFEIDLQVPASYNSCSMTVSVPGYTPVVVAAGETKHITVIVGTQVTFTASLTSLWSFVAYRSVQGYISQVDPFTLDTSSIRLPIVTLVAEKRESSGLLTPIIRLEGNTPLPDDVSVTFTWNFSSGYGTRTWILPAGQQSVGGSSIQDMSVPESGTITAVCDTDGYKVDTMTFEGQKVSSGDTVNATSTIQSLWYIYVADKDAPTKYLIGAYGDGHGTVSPGGPNYVTAGEDFTVTATPSQGYKFNNWTIDDVVTPGTNVYTFINVQAPHTIIANFMDGYDVIIHSQIETGNIKLNGTVINFGSETTKTFRLLDDTFELEYVPIDVDYTFDKWHVTFPDDFGPDVYEEYTSNPATIPLETTSEVYVILKNAQFIVTFDAETNKGTLVGSRTITVTNGQTYGDGGEFPTATREGYTFLGWFTQASGGTQVTESTRVALTKNQTLFAQFDVCSISIYRPSNGSIYLDGSKVMFTSNPMIFEIAKGQRIQLKAVPVDGYVFDKWTFVLLESGVEDYDYNVETSESITEDWEIYADFTINQDDPDEREAEELPEGGLSFLDRRCYLAFYGDKDTMRPTAVLELPNIQAIEENDTATLTEISTVIYGFEDNFCMDTGTVQKYTITLDRVQPLYVRDTGNFDNQQRWSNGHWFKMLKFFIKRWQNLNSGMIEDSTGAIRMVRTGGFKFHFEPGTDNMRPGVSYNDLYPTIDKFAFILGGITMNMSEGNLQHIRVSIPLTVGSMVRLTQDSSTGGHAVTYEMGLGTSVEMQMTYPTGMDFPAANAPQSWFIDYRTIIGLKTFSYWIHPEIGTFYPGEIVDSAVSGLTGSWADPILVFDIKYDENRAETLTLVDKISAEEYRLNSTGLSRITGAEKIHIWVVSGGGGGGGGYYSGTIGVSNTGGGGGSGGFFTGSFGFTVTDLDTIIFQVGEGGSGGSEDGDSGGNTSISLQYDSSSAQITNVPGGSGGKRGKLGGNGAGGAGSPIGGSAGSDAKGSRGGDGGTPVQLPLDLGSGYTIDSVKGIGGTKADGGDGQGYGAGGGGAAPDTDGGTSITDGGDGAPGYILIAFYR